MEPVITAHHNCFEVSRTGTKQLENSYKTVIPVTKTVKPVTKQLQQAHQKTCM